MVRALWAVAMGCGLAADGCARAGSPGLRGGVGEGQPDVRPRKP